MSNYLVDFSDEIKKEQIDELTFGLMSKKLEDQAKENSTLISVDQIPHKPFPENSSQEVLEELNTIKLVQSTSPTWHKGKYKETIDKDFLSIYTDYLDKFNLEYDLDYINGVIKDVGPAILKIKKQYNRPRPNQLSQYHDIDIFVDPTSTAKTPAYPSGHSFQSKVIEVILTKEHPDHKNMFQQITDRVSLARILRGLHFPSDIAFSYYIVKNFLQEKL